MALHSEQASGFMCWGFFSCFINFYLDFNYFLSLFNLGLICSFRLFQVEAGVIDT